MGKLFGILCFSLPLKLIVAAFMSFLAFPISSAENLTTFSQRVCFPSLENYCVVCLRFVHIREQIAFPYRFNLYQLNHITKWSFHARANAKLSNLLTEQEIFPSFSVLISVKDVFRFIISLWLLLHSAIKSFIVTSHCCFGEKIAPCRDSVKRRLKMQLILTFKYCKNNLNKYGKEFYRT